VSANAVIFGCEGPVLTVRERDFFAQANPLGFILFARNCQNPAQVRALVAALRGTIGRADAPVLIDQEGGRVARLRPPHWRAAPAAARFGALARGDLERACRAARLNARLLAAEVGALGISVDCAPVLDLSSPGAAGVIGDRAFGDDPALVAALGRACCEGMLEGGVIPVIKHIPGHGRATVDSHFELPVVDATRAALEQSDFHPFKALADAPWAMTCHVVYRAIDPDHPATLSRAVIADVIRGSMGFDGVLVTDDLSMKALRGGLGARAAAALDAGCDVALHCNGVLGEMEDILAAAPSLTAAAARRLAAAARRPRATGEVDMARLAADLNNLLGA